MTKRKAAGNESTISSPYKSQKESSSKSSKTPSASAKKSKTTKTDDSSKKEVEKKVLSTEYDNLAVDKLYEMLKDEEDVEVIGMEGIVRLFEILGIDPQDVSALMLLWRMGVTKTPGIIHKSEFLTGMNAKLAKRTVKELKTYLPFCDPGFLTSDEFREFYRFTHAFSRENTTKKAIEKDVCVSLLGVVLDEKRCPHLPAFLEFLGAEESKEFTHISPDAWDSFYG